MLIELSFLSDYNFWVGFMSDCYNLINEFPSSQVFSVTNKEISEELSKYSEEVFKFDSPVYRLTIQDQKLEIIKENEQGSIIEHSFCFPASYCRNYVFLHQDVKKIKSDGVSTAAMLISSGLYSKRRFIDETGLSCFEKETCFPKFYCIYPRRDLIRNEYVFMKTKSGNVRIKQDLIIPDDENNFDFPKIASHLILKMPENMRYFLFLGFQFVLEKILNYITEMQKEINVKEMVINSAVLWEKYKKTDRIEEF